MKNFFIKVIKNLRRLLTFWIFIQTKEFLKKIILRGYSSAFVAGKESKEYLLKLGFKEEKITKVNVKEILPKEISALNIVVLFKRDEIPYESNHPLFGQI